MLTEMESVYGQWVSESWLKDS